MNPLLTLLLAALLFLSGPPTDKATLIDNSLRSVFRISHPVPGEPNSLYGCTAFIVDASKGLALTASHCVSGEEVVYIKDIIPVEVIKYDPEKDLGLIRIPLMMGPPLEFAKEIKLGDEAVAVGFGLGRLTTVIRHVAGFIDETNDIMFDGVYIHGMSGGPILNNLGQVIGIVQITQDGIGYGSGPKQMKDFINGKK